MNLAGLEFIDVSGIAALAHGRGHARSAGDALPRPGDRYAGSHDRWEADGFAIHATWPRRPPAREPGGGLAAGVARMRWQPSPWHPLAISGSGGGPGSGNTEDADDDATIKTSPRMIDDSNQLADRRQRERSTGLALHLRVKRAVPSGKQPIREGLITVTD